MSNRPSGAPPTDNFNMRPYWQTLGLITIFAVWPLPVVYLASAVADLNNCTIVETAATPCIVLGADRGGLLFDMASMVQASFITMPIGIALGFVWLCVLIISLMAWRRKRLGPANATKMEANFAYYALSLLAILAIGYATLSGWLPAPVLLLVSFVAIFWIFSFVFALLTLLRDKAKAK